MKKMIARRPWQEWTVAVTGINSKADNPGPGGAVARCLKEHPDFRGRIVGLGYDALDAGLYNKDLFDSSYLLPYPASGEEVLHERMKEIAWQEGLDAVIPCLDSEMQSFAGLAGRLGQYGVRMLTPSREQLTLRAKQHLESFCDSLGIGTPRIKRVTDPGFFDNCEAEGWSYPLMVKGVFYDAVMAHSALEARQAFARLVQSWGYPVLVQKVVKGDEFNLTAIGDGNGAMVAEVMMRKRAVTEKGKAWAGVTVVDHALAALARKIVERLSWSGPLEVEVIRADSGKIYLIEINPRFPSWVYLSHGVGRNLPVTLLKLMDRDLDLSLAHPRTGVLFIRYAQELIVELPEFESIFINGSLRAPVKKWSA